MVKLVRRRAASPSHVHAAASTAAPLRPRLTPSPSLLPFPGRARAADPPPSPSPLHRARAGAGEVGWRRRWAGLAESSHCTVLCEHFCRVGASAYFNLFYPAKRRRHRCESDRPSDAQSSPPGRGTQHCRADESSVKHHGNDVLISSAKELGIGNFRFTKSSSDACPRCCLHPNNPVRSFTRRVQELKSSSCMRQKENSSKFTGYFHQRSIELTTSKIRAHLLRTVQLAAK